MPMNVVFCRDGINIFLSGFIPTENLRFREEALTFKVTDQAEKEELKRFKSFSYPSLRKKQGQFTLTVHKAQSHLYRAQKILLAILAVYVGSIRRVLGLGDHCYAWGERNRKDNIHSDVGRYDGIRSHQRRKRRHQTARIQCKPHDLMHRHTREMPFR